MKILEKILIALALLALIFKFMHWPGGGMLLVLSFGALGVLYFPLGFMLLRPAGDQSFRFPFFLAGWSFSLPVIGLLFKFQYWPGASFMLLTGVIFSIILFAVGIFDLQSSGKHLEKEAAIPLLYRAVIYISLALFFYITPSSSLVKIQYRDQPEYAKLFIRVIGNPSDLQAQEELEKLREERHKK